MSKPQRAGLDFVFTILSDSLPHKFFDEDNKAVFEKKVDFTSDPMRSDMAGTFFIDTAVEASRFELEHKSWKMEGSTGRLMERL